MSPIVLVLLAWLLFRSKASHSPLNWLKRHKMNSALQRTIVYIYIQIYIYIYIYIINIYIYVYRVVLVIQFKKTNREIGQSNSREMSGISHVFYGVCIAKGFHFKKQPSHHGTPTFKTWLQRWFQSCPLKVPVFSYGPMAIPKEAAWQVCFPTKTLAGDWSKLLMMCLKTLLKEIKGPKKATLGLQKDKQNSIVVM